MQEHVPFDAKPIDGTGDSSESRLGEDRALEHDDVRRKEAYFFQEQLGLQMAVDVRAILTAPLFPRFFVTHL